MSGTGEIAINCTYDTEKDIFDFRYEIGKNTDEKTDLGLAGYLAEHYIKTFLIEDEAEFSNAETEAVKIESESKKIIYS